MIVLCRDNFLFLNEDSFNVVSFVLVVADCVILLALLLACILDEDGGKEPDLYYKECN